MLPNEPNDASAYALIDTLCTASCILTDLLVSHLHVHITVHA